MNIQAIMGRRRSVPSFITSTIFGEEHNKSDTWPGDCYGHIFNYDWRSTLILIMKPSELLFTSTKSKNRKDKCQLDNNLLNNFITSHTDPQKDSNTNILPKRQELKISRQCPDTLMHHFPLSNSLVFTMYDKEKVNFNGAKKLVRWNE